MRIDGFTSSYPLERSPRQGSAVTPFREIQREAEARREQPGTPSSTQGFEQAPQPRRVQAGNASGDSLPVRPQDLIQQQRSISNRAAQAIASYSTTAQFVADYDAPEVLGLDLYA
ncbi:hypothetical protein [Metapseudomonas resinovorans]|uniref:Uncharacterized protein n=1 Tax=Metapseudomonas resinovorans NBRC 106553 TaxID=1245471 RepID=S6AZE7_METRE|nr:hypothetical protein [Pseudomonas resinovorans]BAN50301.1 hypothetical protein PCA10_45690 [Pseudomonas resinovorans NBRC 106553]